VVGITYSGGAGISVKTNPINPRNYIISAPSILSSISGLDARISDLESAS